jgi:exopolyphosphatase/guanosine-5'-triphosphate,3'-diphosphate pyrophosphatase
MQSDIQTAADGPADVKLGKSVSEQKNGLNKGSELKTAAILEEAIVLCGGDDFEQQHARQVAKLAIKLFDKLQPLHRMGNSERIWLRVASLLHDVGKSVSGVYHHKASRDIIVKQADLPFRKRVRKIIGLVARYHRGALPSDSHKYYRGLKDDEKQCVKVLAAVLRLADGLDAGHEGLITDLACEVQRKRMVLYILGEDGVDLHKAVKKADLFEQVFGREVEIRAVAAGRVRDINLDSSRSRVYAHAA